MGIQWTLTFLKALYASLPPTDGDLFEIAYSNKVVHSHQSMGISLQTKAYKQAMVISVELLYVD